MAATLDQSTPWLGLCHHADTKAPMATTLDQSTPWLGLCHHADTKAPMATTRDQSTPWLGPCHHTDTKAQHLTRVHLGWDCVITPTPRLQHMTRVHLGWDCVISPTPRRLWLQHLTRVHLGWDCVITPTPRCNTLPEYTLAGTVSSHRHQGATFDQSTPWLGRCHDTDTKATLKCCYALHGYVGTTSSYNEFLEQQHPPSII